MALRSDYPKRLGPTTLTTSPTTLFTAPERVILADIVFTNFDVNVNQVWLYIVPAGGTAGNANAIVSNKNIGPNDVYEFTQQYLTLEQGETLQAKASANSVVNLTMAATNQESGVR